MLTADESSLICDHPLVLSWVRLTSDYLQVGFFLKLAAVTSSRLHLTHDGAAIGLTTNSGLDSIAMVDFRP